MALRSNLAGFGDSGKQVFGSNTRPIYLFNTLTKQKELFVPIRPRKAGMYNCGPTVYNFAHIGNLRSYVFADTVKRMLMWNGFEVSQVINITDIGHLTDDADAGDDKMGQALKREGKEPTLRNMKTLANKYTKSFVADLELLNITLPNVMPKATEHIPEQIAFIKTLEEKGYTYKTSDGIYFDTSCFKEYGKLGGVGAVSGDQSQARINTNPEKKDQRDFALWKFNDTVGFEAVWGKGFPGWHIECSAMSMKYLGKTFDIHTGGIDHISTHHNNEIAQSEAATGKPFVHYWMHHDFLTVDSRKISKSSGDSLYLKNLTNQGIPPLAYRFWLLTAHYRTHINFSFEALEAATKALFKIQKYMVEELGVKIGKVNENFQNRFGTFINDDLDTPQAIALIFELIKNTEISEEDKLATLLNFDKALGIGLTETHQDMIKMYKKKPTEIPEEILKLMAERENARKAEKWEESDRLRQEIQKKGYEVIDTADGQKLQPQKNKKKTDLKSTL